jgi:hypothetical protein
MERLVERWRGWWGGRERVVEGCNATTYWV